ncbi:YczE/YyaS/YitT family protein [Youngiibacter fragilis]|uniref:YitT family protein n=1 Tax=Youngiibacter fragilis 232.1 TaxID=994573 RepID=V7I8F5_9CLOT|nr:DUF6198 family protein [Youngiibacter fragilis]ETA82123.1 hypothetical protein T472_0202860 [Youngiibacter fragilis 232.1]
MKALATRFIMFVLGLFILSYGVALAIRSSLGVSPISSFPVSISRVTGLTVGRITIFFYLFLVLMQILILRKDFKVKNLLQIAFSSVFGFFTDSALSVTASLAPQSYPVKLAFLLTSVCLMGLAIFMLLVADIVNNSPEALCKAIADKYSIDFARVKTWFDLSCVAGSATVSMVFFRDIGMIREGTIIGALFIGKVGGFLYRSYKHKVVSMLGI